MRFGFAVSKQYIIVWNKDSKDLIMCESVECSLIFSSCCSWREKQSVWQKRMWITSKSRDCWLLLAVFLWGLSISVCIYWPIYLVDGQGACVTKSGLVCWKSCAYFEGLWAEKTVMEWAGKDCDSSIESGGACWIRLICLWMGSFHYSC